MTQKLASLRAQLQSHAPLVVAYSGGVDSAYLARWRHIRTLGPEVLGGVIADSLQPPASGAGRWPWRSRSKALGARVEVVKTGELDNPDYASNPPNRCYFCKAELFANLDTLARKRGFRAIAYGENADDMRHERPGRKAATEFAVLAPLRDAGLTKAEIRALSRDLGLPTADAPAQPCLSSRIPWGTPVTASALEMIERGEAGVRALGFRVFRVRHIVNENAASASPVARVQVAPEELVRLSVVERELTAGLLSAGYAGVEIDPAGYRSPG